MNKIVCDVCGTSYPETAPQCPICGTAKTDSAKTTTGGDSGYAYVKGGRFSHANVRKRNAGKKELPRVVAPVKSKKEAAPKPAKEAAPSNPKSETPVAKKPATKPIRQKPDQDKRERGTNIILAIIALVLVIAIIAVFAYIVKGWIDDRNPADSVDSTTTQSTAASTSGEIPCTGVRLALSEKTFTSLEDKFYLSVTVSPENTTDTVWYESDNELIATVDEKGIVYPVANGQVTIYVHCGEHTAECVITCDVGVEPTDPNQPTEPNVPTEPAVPDVELKLNRDEFTLNGYGDSWMLYSGELDPATITWTSSDETVATVTNGKVVAVGNGYCTITAEYMGQTVNCAVRCINVVVSDYELGPDYGYGPDYTIKVGKTLVLYLVDKETGRRVQAEELTFTVSKEGIISIDENGKITAVAAGTVYVTVSYGGQTYKATVRVTSR